MPTVAHPPTHEHSPIHKPLNRWYAVHARDLPWRQPGTTPWAILLSEVMSQQTPVARVIPLWRAWLERWPDMRELAEAPTADVLRAWDNLGYPRRALRLKECAQVGVHKYGGELPSTVGELESLPGIGNYTARAVASFAFGQAVPVVDTNVRRVQTRLVRGEFLQSPARASDLAAVADLMPWVDEDPALMKRGYRNPTQDPTLRDDAQLMTQALMELGALVCTARKPRCEECPLTAHCRWFAEGKPMPSEKDRQAAARKVQKFEGTDRQVRGKVMALLRASERAVVTPGEVDAVWPDKVQLKRVIESLLADGLMRQTEGGYQFPR